MLTEDQKKARLAYALAHVNDDDETIVKRVFADEKRFSVGGGNTGLWLLKNEPRPIREKSKFDTS